MIEKKTSIFKIANIITRSGRAGAGTLNRMSEAIGDWDEIINFLEDSVSYKEIFRTESCDDAGATVTRTLAHITDDGSIDQILTVTAREERCETVFINWESFEVRKQQTK